MHTKQHSKKIRTRKLVRIILRFLSRASYFAALFTFLKGAIFHIASPEELLSGEADVYLLIKLIEMLLLILVGMLLCEGSDRLKVKTLHKEKNRTALRQACR